MTIKNKRKHKYKNPFIKYPNSWVSLEQLKAMQQFKEERENQLFKYENR